LDLTPLNLTPEQKQQIQGIRKKTSTKARDLRKTLREKRLEMRESMFDPDTTEAQLRNKHRQIRKLQEQAENTMFEDFLTIRALLTPEQKKHLPEIKPPLREPPRLESARPSGPARSPDQATVEVKAKTPN
jgi:Spy/CpxP family protein refolding chaperone